MQRLVESPALRALDVLVGEWTIEIPDPPAELPTRTATSRSSG